MKNKKTVLASAVAAMSLLSASVLLDVNQNKDACRPLEDMISWNEKNQIERTLTEVALVTGERYQIDLSCTNGIYRKGKEQALNKLDELSKSKDTIEFRSKKKNGETTTTTIDIRDYKNSVNQKLDKIK